MTSLLIIAYIYKIETTGDIIFLSGMVGFFLIPLPSILISYGSEIVFPIDESSSAGYLLASTQTFGFLIGFGSISFLNKTKERSEIIGFVMMGLLLLSFIFAVWVKEDLKKMKFEESIYSQHKSEADLKSSLLANEQS